MVGCLILLLGNHAKAQPKVDYGRSGASRQSSWMPPWTDPGEIPVFDGAQSVFARGDDVAVFDGPAPNAKRVGTLGKGAEVPLFAMRRAPGCAARWVMIGPMAWVCQDKLQFSKDLPIGVNEIDYNVDEHGLLYDYYVVGSNGAWGYSHLRSVDIAVPDQSYEPGFFIAIERQQQRDGEMFGRSSRGMWIAMRELRPVQPSRFRGEILEDGVIDFAWVYKDNVFSFAQPAGKKTNRLQRLELVKVLEEKTERRQTYYRISDGAWVSERDVRRARVSQAPSEISTGQRWIDIDLQSQTLVAYVGQQPVFATIVSTGRGRAGSGYETPVGTHRIWVKLITSSMGNVSDDAAQELYSIEDVPYVQFFSRGVGLHGTLWHDRFGNVQSHGCVNLSPADAQWLFYFTSPMLPAGWRAVLPSAVAPATIVRVR